MLRPRMKTLLCFTLILFSIKILPAESKYGFFGESDEALLDRVREEGVTVVILGCIYRCEVR